MRCMSLRDAHEGTHVETNHCRHESAIDAEAITCWTSDASALRIQYYSQSLHGHTVAVAVTHECRWLYQAFACADCLEKSQHQGLYSDASAAKPEWHHSEELTSSLTIRSNQASALHGISQCRKAV